jgi:Subtilase family
MPEFVTDGVIPDRFVDYTRRLVAYTTESDARDRAFQDLFEMLSKPSTGAPRGFDVDDTVMLFTLGNTNVAVFYLHNEQVAVGEVIRRIREQPRFADISLERDVRMVMLQQAVPNDPLYRFQWGLKKIGIEAASKRVAEVTPPRPAVTVAIIDSGIQKTHEDLDSASISGLRVIPPASNNFADDIGHGTMVAGTITAHTNNALGIAGEASNIYIFAVKFNDVRTPPTGVAAVAAIYQALLRGAKIINASWHVLNVTGLLALAIQSAGSQGCLVVAAAGNSGSDNTEIPTLPASYDFDNMVVAMASDEHDEKAWFSNYGANVDLAAPGVRILSTGLYYVNPAYRGYSGTSAAAAYVSGAAALLLKIDDWTPQEIRTHLIASAEPVRKLRGLCQANGRLSLSRAVLGPFSIVRPQAAEQLRQGASYRVQWRSAYDTPVVRTVEIAFIDQATGAILSRFGGLPNNGRSQVVVPNVATRQAIVRVRCEQKNLYADSRAFRIV